MIEGHGWVHPREDGAKARCGGPAICGQCASEKAQKDSDEELERQMLAAVAKAHVDGEIQKLEALAATIRLTVVAMLRVCSDEIQEMATEARKPLPQGDGDVEARVAIDQQAIGLDLAADHLLEKADELEGKPRRWKF
jgi:hypothetical protein